MKIHVSECELHGGNDVRLMFTNVNKQQQQQQQLHKYWYPVCIIWKLSLSPSYGGSTHTTFRIKKRSRQRGYWPIKAQYTQIWLVNILSLCLDLLFYAKSRMCRSTVIGKDQISLSLQLPAESSMSHSRSVWLLSGKKWLICICHLELRIDSTNVYIYGLEYRP